MEITSIYRLRNHLQSINEPFPPVLHNLQIWECPKGIIKEEHRQVRAKEVKAVSPIAQELQSLAVKFKLVYA